MTGSVRLGGIVSRAPHPAAGALNGGPQMVEVSRDGRRVYVSNSLYASWDAQFYPEGIRGWVAKLDADPAGGLSVDPEFLMRFDGERPHQIRLEGGDLPRRIVAEGTIVSRRGEAAGVQFTSLDEDAAPVVADYVARGREATSEDQH